MDRLSHHLRATAYAVLALAAGVRTDPAEPQVLGLSLTPVLAPELTTAGYVCVPMNHEDGSVEHRCYFRGQHFLSVLRDVLGGFAVRMHPGVDVNGWGTTVYPHPHLSGVPLTGAVITQVAALPGHVAVAASGPLKDGAGGQVGTWTTALQFTFSPGFKKVSATGSLRIVRTQSLTAGQDVDVVKMASNFLVDVPLLTGGTGNTGDTEGALVMGSNLTQQSWEPALQPGHFPQERCDWLEIFLGGCYNVVDTARQLDPNHPGQYHEPIAAAYKPSTRMRFDLQQSGQDVPFIFGASFDTDHATDFTSDNISVTPQIRYFSPLAQHDFVLILESGALPEDANQSDVALSVEHYSAEPVMDVFFSGNLESGSWRRVGSLKRRNGGTYSATFKVPEGPRGFVRAEAGE